MKYAKLLLFGLGIAVIFSFFYYLGLPEILAVITNADFRFIGLSFLTEALILLLLAFKLQTVVNGQGRMKMIKGSWSAGTFKGIKFAELFKTTIAGLMVSFITPVARLGGEPVKIMVLRKNGIGTATSTAIIAVDTFTELFSYYIIVMLSIIFILQTGKLPYAVVYPFITLLVLSTAVLIIFFIMCFNYSLLKKFVVLGRWVTRRFSKSDMSKKKDYAWIFYDLFRLMFTNKLFMLRVFAISFIVKVLEFLRMYFLFKAFFYDVSFVTIILAWSIMLLVGMIPLLPGGLGIVEAGGVYAYIMLGVTKPVAGAVMALDRLFSFWFVIFLGSFIISPVGMHERLESLKNARPAMHLWLMRARRKLRLRRY